MRNFFIKLYYFLPAWIRLPIPFIKHEWKIYTLRRKYARVSRRPSIWVRVLQVLIAAAISFFLLTIKPDFEGTFIEGTHLENLLTPSNEKDGGTKFFSIYQLLVSAPILFILWVLRDHNRLREIENQRKDTNLKEFQQLQQWATGNTGSVKDDHEAHTALRISALHSLRGYLKGEYGEDFRRPAFEIFASVLATEHEKILEEVKEWSRSEILDRIEKSPLVKQLNRIASEEWFNLLINHTFPTATISLVGVDLSKRYLQNKSFSKRLDLSESSLIRANLSNAYMRNVYLYGAHLQGVDMEEAQLQNADLSFANLEQVNLSESSLQGVFLFGANLRLANMSFAKAQGAMMDHSYLQGASLFKTKLQGSSLASTQLQGSFLDNAQLQGSQLVGANLQGSSLFQTQFQGALLWGVYFQGTELSETNFSGGYGSEENDLPKGVSSLIKRANKKADLSGFDDTLLSITKKNELIQMLEQLNKIEPGNDDLQYAIERIKNMKGALDFGKSKTGSYTKQEAKVWIKEYKKARRY